MRWDKRTDTGLKNVQEIVLGEEPVPECSEPAQDHADP